MLRCVCFLCVCWLLVELVRKKPKCRLTASQHSEGSFFSRLARSSPKRNMQMSVRQRTHTYKITLSHSLDSTVSLREQRVFISATWARGVKERERKRKKFMLQLPYSGRTLINFVCVCVGGWLKITTLFVSKQQPACSFLPALPPATAVV